MTKDPKDVRRRPAGGHPLDATDRTLLGLLAADATRSYAQLGEALHLSPPAVHERVRRLKAEGVITGVTARLDPARVGRPLLAFVEVDLAGWRNEAQMLALADLPEVEEVHAVTGGVGMLVKVRTRDPRALEDVLRRLYAIEGVRGTRSHVVLSTLLERGPQVGAPPAGAPPAD